MKTYYYFNANSEIIETREFLNDDEAWNHMFEPCANPEICAWNDAPYLNE